MQSNEATLGTIVPPPSQQDTIMPHMSHADTTLSHVFNETNVLGTATTSMHSTPGLPHLDLNNEPQPPIPLGHSMTTRSKDSTLKPNYKYLSSDYICFADATPSSPKTIKSTLEHSGLPVTNKDFAEPILIRQALTRPNWVLAMHEEIDALTQNQTWILIPRTHNMNVVG